LKYIFILKVSKLTITPKSQLIYQIQLQNRIPLKNLLLAKKLSTWI